MTLTTLSLLCLYSSEVKWVRERETMALVDRWVQFAPFSRISWSTCLSSPLVSLNFALPCEGTIVTTYHADCGDKENNNGVSACAYSSLSFFSPSLSLFTFLITIFPTLEKSWRDPQSVFLGERSVYVCCACACVCGDLGKLGVSEGCSNPHQLFPFY